jgi:hypothetical protein
VEHVVELPAASHAPVVARRALARVPGVSGELGYKALLLVSEVVTVWVARAQDREQPAIPVRVDVSDSRVRVEITDDGDAAATAGDGAGSRPLRVDPYARRILERLADRWGVEGEDRAAIWFELDRGPAVTAFGSAPGRPK